MFGICNLAIVPLRAEPSDRSEIVSQLLFGEHFEIIDQQQQWIRIRADFDRYEGWMDVKQMQPIAADAYKELSREEIQMNADLIEYVHANNVLIPIPLGASLAFLDRPDSNLQHLEFEGTRISGIQPKENLIPTAFLYLNAPYLWGGKTPFGIDCSGFTQMVYKLNGQRIPRDASQQALVGEPLSFIEESEPGDLAFFDNDEGNIIHVGIIMENNYIIHASGKVRVDRLDHLGIYNPETNRHTHKLRVIKKYL